jgi:hypothetical protein
MVVTLDLRADMSDFTVRQNNCTNRVELALFGQKILSHWNKRVQ